MARFFCEGCQKESNFLPIYTVTKIAGVSRSTIYYWLERGWVHWLQLPSGRRVICEASLTRPQLRLPISLPKQVHPRNHPKLPTPQRICSGGSFAAFASRLGREDPFFS